MEYHATTVVADLSGGFIADIFIEAGCAPVEGARIAHHLLSASLKGHDCHGVIRTPRYVQWLLEGKVRAGLGLTVVHETPTQATAQRLTIADGHIPGCCRHGALHPRTESAAARRMPSAADWGPMTVHCATGCHHAARSLPCRAIALPVFRHRWTEKRNPNKGNGTDESR